MPFRGLDRGYDLAEKPHIVGIVGTGYVARGLARAIRNSTAFVVGSVLTRRNPGEVSGFIGTELVTSIEGFLDRAEIVVECSGDPVHATDVIEHALLAGRPVVTMNSEWQVTAGSYYRGHGYITEAEGDQPGSLAALAEDACAMGFEPRVYLNVKGFLNLTPTVDEMAYFSTLHGFSLPQVVSFTDGTKNQIELALVANGLGADILRPGLLGPAGSRIDGGLETLAEAAIAHGRPIVDYVLTGECPGAVMILASHSAEEAQTLRTYKLGDGPYYRMMRPYHLCHLEILKTLSRVTASRPPLLDNGARPTISVAALAKRRLLPGERIARGLGSFDVRGECVRIAESSGHIPITLLQNAFVRREVRPGEMLMMDDIESPESRALHAWLITEETVLKTNDSQGAEG